MFKISTLLGTLLISLSSFGNYLLVPMDESQADHLKAYGVVHKLLNEKQTVKWMLNYRGGSFLLNASEENANLLFEKGVLYASLTQNEFNILVDSKIRSELGQIVDGSGEIENKLHIVKMEKAPKIALYASDFQINTTDPVSEVLNYAGIPFDLIKPEEIINGDIYNYDWLHIHHEDFTGQYGKFWASYRDHEWFKNGKKRAEENAVKMGFGKVSKYKLTVARKIREYISNGGFLFAMCTAADSYDIALAAGETDICGHMYDGDEMDSEAQSKLDFDQTVAFGDFQIETNPVVYEFSSIDASRHRRITPSKDYFTLVRHVPHQHPELCMLNQNHVDSVKGFMGATTAYQNSTLKEGVNVLGELKKANEARYIHGKHGDGMWAFLGGHDPEDYQTFVGEKFEWKDEFKNSPGYRLILNNVLFRSVNIGPKELDVDVRVFPNPATDQTQVNFKAEEEQDLNLSIFSSDGKLVYNESLPNFSGSYSKQLDLSGYAMGIYFIKINGSNKVKSQRFVVE